MVPSIFPIPNYIQHSIASPFATIFSNRTIYSAAGMKFVIMDMTRSRENFGKHCYNHKLTADDYTTQSMY